MAEWKAASGDLREPAKDKLPISTGYFVNIPDISARLKERRNAVLTYGDKEVSLLITDLAVSLALGGSTSQSRTLRTFWPRSLGAATFTVKGQTWNQMEAQRIAEFVRMTQLESLDATGSARNSLVHLVVFATQIELKNAKGQVVGTIEGKNLTSGKNKQTLRNMKGGHDAFNMAGYIPAIRRGSERWVNAPDYQFDFVITQSLKDGLFEDKPLATRQIESWTQIFKELPKSRWVGNEWKPNPTKDSDYSLVRDQPVAPTTGGAPPSGPGPGGTLHGTEDRPG